MEIRYQHSPNEAGKMNTEELRTNFLVQKSMEDDQIKYMYSHYDRAIIGGVKPVTKSIFLECHAELKSDYFLERRELGIINVGGKGMVQADGINYSLEKLTCLYLGKGTKQVSFSSKNSLDPALFFLMSTPAHQIYPNILLTKEEAAPVGLGNHSTSNKRTIYKYIHTEGIKSCQLVMGLTVLEEGSVWNSIPPHTHTRRMEVYFYFDVPEQQLVFHYMGQSSETRHLAVKNLEAVISPPWSVHFGGGTSNYAFIWAMAGENQVFSDMDALALSDLK
jgi:4-deoxy-L-threo-5-hexosulose-uronate ketol-isomerase